MNSQTLLQLTAFSRVKEIRETWLSLAKDYENKLNLINQGYLILSLLKDTKLPKYNQCKKEFSISKSCYEYIYATIHGVPLEMVIDFWCSKIHQTFNVDWKMEVEYSYIILRTHINKITLSILVYEEEAKSCEIVAIKHPIPVESKEPEFRTEYLISCAED